MVKTPSISPVDLERTNRYDNKPPWEDKVYIKLEFVEDHFNGSNSIKNRKR